MMHQLLQDMGRDVVRQESPNKPWERSILWNHEECLDVLQNKQGTTIIQGLVLVMRTFENETRKEPSSVNMKRFGLFSGMHSSSRKTKGDFETLALSEMRNLRLLQLNYVQLSGSYKNFPQGIRWLCMHGFPLSYIPSDLQMDNMIALDLSNSKLQQLWKKPKLLRSLKFLNLSGCHELVRVGHFSGLPLLERLTLAKCTSLVEVCESIGNYSKKLEVLDLSECSKLKELPRSIGELKNLTHLLIDGCSNLEILKSNGSSSSTMVPRSPKSFVSSLPRSLVTLSLTYCNLYNELFPMDFSNLPMLKKLFLDGNPIDSMPHCVRGLSRLDTLSFSDCSNLKTVVCAPIQLKRLDIFVCNSLEKITFHPEQLVLPAIEYLNKFTMTEIQHIFKIQALSEIDEEVLHSLGWINIPYLNQCRFWKAGWRGAYFLSEEILPAQMLYEHGIFSTYIQGQEVPEWFTQRSGGSLFTLQSSPENGKIKGLNVCIVHTVSSMEEVGPSRIEIRNLTKNSSWTYQPMMYLVPEDDTFEDVRSKMMRLEEMRLEKIRLKMMRLEKMRLTMMRLKKMRLKTMRLKMMRSKKMRSKKMRTEMTFWKKMRIKKMHRALLFGYTNYDGFEEVDEVVIVWLSHWMFGENEFEDGDEVSIHFTVEYHHSKEQLVTSYDSEEPDYANVREYGISPVYDDDDDGGGGKQKEDPLGYYKSWKNIIGGDLSAFELSSSHYLLHPGY
ncbi:putative leucine-rich repeat domain superfamily [Helianthus annuus]|nr:putative leucine-rich repeat domain superfamily [Helianthus annuus]